MTIIGRDEMTLRNIDTECPDSPTGKHESRPDRWGDDICIWCLEEPIPDSIADIAAEHGVTEAQLRAALREAHPDAGVAEVILAAREAPDADDEDGPPLDLNPEGDPYRNGAFG